jgi:histidyl-tRNA synthetase
LFSPPTKTTVTATGTTTGAPPPTVIDTKAVASDATAVKAQNPELDAAARNNLTNIQEASVNTVRAEENIQINNRSIQANEQSQAQALEQQRQAQAIIDQNNAELADDNLPESRRAELEANNAAQLASIAENAAIIDEAQNNIDQSTANNEKQVNSILENQYVATENAAAYRINTTGGVY